MIYTVIEEQLDGNNVLNAGCKARDDLSHIFKQQGISDILLQCPQIERETVGIIGKVGFHLKIARQWEKALSILKEGDVLLIQFPIVNHTLFFNRIIKKLHSQGAKVCAFIHDLESIRVSNDQSVSFSMRWRMKMEEVKEMQQFDAIVAHNEAMKSFISSKFSIPEERIVVLGLFDYLVKNDYTTELNYDNYKSCIIAGNLDKQKAGYVYSLPDAPSFELFGVNYSSTEEQENIHYHGAFEPDDLPNKLHGGFGLVWDGNSAKDCLGAWGQYLRYNNPHKASLYLVSGIPVIIWKKAALAPFIEHNNLGITVDSIYEIQDALSSLSVEDYSALRKSTRAFSDKLRNGYFTQKAINACLESI